MDDYIVYGEIETARGAMEQKLSLSKEGVTVKITRCPWCTVWREESLTEWGRLYCREIDSSIVRGFNPELALDVEGTMSNGSPSCVFIFHGAGNMLKIAWRKAVRPGRGALRPWDFHVGHLFATMESVFVQKLGEEGARAAKAGAAEFGRRFGEAALQRLCALKNSNVVEEVEGK